MEKSQFVHFFKLIYLLELIKTMNKYRYWYLVRDDAGATNYQPDIKMSA